MPTEIWEVGHKLFFWSDRWLGGPLKNMYELLFSISLNLEATDADLGRGEGDNVEWLFMWRRELFEWDLSCCNF